MDLLTGEHLTRLVHEYGYGLIALVVGAESIGLPLPGEAMLLAAAVYAGTTHNLNITIVVLSAIAGAIVGDNIGFLVGRSVGTRLLSRYGARVGLTAERLEFGHFLFRRHGGKVVLFGRFVALLRTLAAVLAGANGMAWGKFLAANAAGAVLWAALYGYGAWWLGAEAKRLAGPVGIVTGVIGAVVIAGAVLVARRQEKRIMQAARQ